MRKLPIASIILVAALAGCAGAVTKATGDKAGLRYTEYAGEPIERFTAFYIDNWTPVSRNQLVVWTGINDAYLLKVWDHCDKLQFTERVAVKRTGYSVSRLDSVQVGDQTCPIEEIRRVDIKHMKLDRAAQRAKP